MVERVFENVNWSGKPADGDPNPIRSVRLGRAVVRSGTRVELEVRYDLHAAGVLTVASASEGFTVDAGATLLSSGAGTRKVVLFVRRRHDASGHACVLRLWLNGHHADTSITVVPRPVTRELPGF